MNSELLNFYFIVFVSIVLYGSILLISLFAKSKSIFYFVSISVILRAISFPLIYYHMDLYTHTGWSAIREFSFLPSEFFDLIISDISSLVLIVIASFSLNNLTKSMINENRYRFKKISLLGAGSVGINNKIILPAFAIFTIINSFVFCFSHSHKIGIPGVAPEQFPFKIAGIVHYYEKIVGPVILFFIVNRSKSPFIIVATGFFLFFVAFSTLSRSTVIMWMLPTLYVVFVNKNKLFYRFLTIFLAFFSIIMAAVGRDLMYFQDKNAIDVDLAIDFVDVFQGAFYFIQNDWSMIIAGLISRLGGAQEMILGSQVEFPDLAFQILLLGQVFTGLDFGLDYQQLVMMTHGFLPLDGAVANLSYSGYMIAFSRADPIVFLLFVAASAVVLCINELIVSLSHAKCLILFVFYLFLYSLVFF